MEYNFDKFYLLPHPFKDHIPKFAKYLVIGTFPAHKRNFEFYYSGDGNRFWFVLGKVFDKAFKENSGSKAITERKDFLTEHRIAMTDMHKTCYRKNKSSGDEHLYSVTLKDIIELIECNNTIDTLVFTSRTDAIGALGLFKILMMRKGLSIPEFIPKSNKVLFGQLIITNRIYDIYVPYSPSNRVSDFSTDKLIDMYRYIFSDQFN